MHRQVTFGSDIRGDSDVNPFGIFFFCLFDSFETAPRKFVGFSVSLSGKIKLDSLPKILFFFHYKCLQPDPLLLSFYFLFLEIWCLKYVQFLGLIFNEFC